MRRALALVVLAACGGNDSDWNMIVPGSGGGAGGSTRVDAPAGDGGSDALSTITGKLCLLTTNPQTLTSCEPSGVANYTVALEGVMTQTADDGSFSLTPPSIMSGAKFTITGTDLKTSIIPFSYAPKNVALPAIRLTTYELMVADNQATSSQSTGAVMIQIKKAGVLVTGATVSSLPAPDGPSVLYDGASSSAWTTTATGANGVAWLSSIPATSATLTVTSGSTPTMFANIPLAADTITYVFAEIP